MNETPRTDGEWEHASWVSPMGKFAWIVIVVVAAISLVFKLLAIGPTIAAWEALKIVYEGLGWPVPPLPIGGLIWGIIGAIVSIFIGFAIIRPKFSNKCASKDWDALYNWTLSLGGLKIPWMFIWGIILVIFGWFYAEGVLVLVPAIMLIFFGPKPYNWSE